VGVGLAWGPQLRWAAGELPRMLRGGIGTPAERDLYRRAREIIRSGERMERAELLLRRSLAIDPRGEAGYWLGEYFYRAGRDDEALAQLQAYLTIDPTIADAYLRLASVHERRGEADAARSVLERGRVFFAERHASLAPRPDPRVGERYNEKAVEVWEECARDAARLADEIARLDRASEGPHR
jgi:tetratricopeptide (TPR) repeat protein